MKSKILTLLLFACVGCSKNAEKQAHIEVASTTTVAARPADANLVEVNKEVSLRRASELVWIPARAPSDLFSFDALQSHQASTARVVFKSGSQLRLKENTFVVINGEEDKIDRAVMREGQVSGEAKSEMWVLTPGAVVKLKPKANIASAEISVEKEKQLAIKVTQGEVEVRDKTLKVGEQVILSAPKVSENFGSKADWIETAKILKDAIAPTTTQAQVQAAVQQEATLQITSPTQNKITTSEDEITVSGQVAPADGNVFINGKKYQIDSSGKFSNSIDLNDGVNLIIVQWTSPAGKTLVRKLVIRRKPS